jgi:hypothetical protein
MNNKMRIRRPLSKRGGLSTGGNDELFLQWLNTAFRDEKWRAFIRERARQNELPVIQFADEDRRAQNSCNVARSARVQ